MHSQIRRLHFVEKWPIGTVAAQLNVHPDVVRRACGLLERKAVASRPGVLEPYKGFIQETLKHYPRLRATRLMSMVVQRGYCGSIKTLRNYVREVRPQKNTTAMLRVETLPAQQCQVDWAHVGKLSFHGAQRNLWLFVMVLSYSRAMWGEFVLDLSASSLYRSMVRALDYFEGSPRIWLFDNAKSIVVSRYKQAVRFHEDILRLADTYRAEPRVCQVRAPHQKGKVERTIRYVRDAFLVGRDIGSVAQGNRELLEFVETTALKRPHPVRKQETVYECLAHERQLLVPLPESPVSTDQVQSGRVSRDAFVRFDGNSYSVPPDLVGKQVSVVASDSHIRIVVGETCRCEHRRSWGKQQRIEYAGHRTELLEQRQAAQPACAQEKLRTIAPSIDQLFERWVKENRHIASCTNKARKLLELYGETLFATAVNEVVTQGTHDVGALAMACEQLRMNKNRPVPVPLRLGNHVPEKDVIPHAMEDYDHVNSN